MRENYMEMKVTITELKVMLMKQVVDGDITSIDVEGFAALQACLKLVKSSEELMDSYIDMMEEQDKKLDRILRALEAAR